MKMRRELAVVVFVVAVALVGLRAAEDPISGTWVGSAASAQGGSSLKLDLKLEGEKVSGTAATDQGSQEIKDGTWKDGVLTFKTSYNGVPVVLSGSIKDARLVGTFSYDEGAVLGEWSASRPAEK